MQLIASLMNDHKEVMEEVQRDWADQSLSSEQRWAILLSTCKKSKAKV